MRNLVLEIICKLLKGKKKLVNSKNINYYMFETANQLHVKAEIIFQTSKKKYISKET